MFDILATASSEPNRRRLQTIEDSGAIPGASYFNEVLADDVPNRVAFMERLLVAPQCRAKALLATTKFAPGSG